MKRIDRWLPRGLGMKILDQVTGGGMVTIVMMMVGLHIETEDCLSLVRQYTWCFHISKMANLVYKVKLQG
ncbi:hypothetical protein HHK36_003001 [Tetracentron sinense]|uniref:Uncharacterized protein n=1 Tax=Tetracentron sinense TaxID=13715 RepID=A0A834ZQE6_TETSI|nr:hypothetical protein HHK36_003001 [Tetracentron sinense]